MTDLTREQIVALLVGTTQGPWTVETGNVPIADTGDYDGYCRLMAGGRIIFEQWGDDEQSEKDANLAGAAPALARQLLATLDALAAANAALEAKVARLVGIADDIDAQVKTTREAAADSGMDRHQVELVAICTSHFLDNARHLRALATIEAGNG